MPVNAISEAIPNFLAAPGSGASSPAAGQQAGAGGFAATLAAAQGLGSAAAPATRTGSGTAGSVADGATENTSGGTIGLIAVLKAPVVANAPGKKFPMGTAAAPDSLTAPSASAAASLAQWAVPPGNPLPNLAVAPAVPVASGSVAAPTASAGIGNGTGVAVVATSNAAGAGSSWPDAMGSVASVDSAQAKSGSNLSGSNFAGEVSASVSRVATQSLPVQSSPAQPLSDQPRENQPASPLAAAAPSNTSSLPSTQLIATLQPSSAVAESTSQGPLPAPILTTAMLPEPQDGIPSAAVETSAAGAQDNGNPGLPGVVADAASAAVSAAVSLAASLPMAADVTNIAAAILNTPQSSAPAIPVAAPGSAAARPGAAPVTPLATPGNTNLRGTPTAPTVAPTSQSDSHATAAVGEQTPFDVYFSSPAANSGLGQGSSVESAAGILPRMILPAVHGATSSLANSAGANLSPQAAIVAGAGTFSGTVQPVKGSLPGGQSGTPSEAAPRRDALQTSAAVATASTVPAVSAQTASIPAVAAATVATAAPTVAPAAPAVAAPVVAAGAVPATPDLPAKLPTPAANGGETGTVPTPPMPAPVLPPGPVQVAQMATRVGQSEMRIGMNTSAFGSVEVRTVVHASDVGLTIGSEKGDLRGLLTNEMPALANSLQQQNLRLNSVSYMQGFGYSSNNSGNGGGSQQQQSFRPQSSIPAESLGAAETGNDAVEMATAGELAYAGGSLSILA